MGKRPFEVDIGPPYAGLNSYADTYTLTPKQFTDMESADIARGVLSGYFGLGTSVTTLAANTRFAYYQPGFTPSTNGWLSSTALFLDGRCNHACRDTKDANGNQVSYLTQVQAGGTVNVPLAYYGSTSYTLGVVAPTTQPAVSSTASGGARAYSYTYYDSVRGIESNPLAITATSTNCNGCVISGLPTTAPTGTGVDKIRIYGTAPGSTTGTKYRVGEIAIAAGSYTETNPAVAGTIALNWGAGGYFKSTALPYDHSPAGQLTCLSDGIHAALVADTDATGLGILFGAIDQYAVWSRLGYAHYWPTTQNKAKLPFYILAMATRGAVTYAFTEGGIWSFSGVDDTAIQIQRTSASLGILRLAGKSVAQSPLGIIYMSRRGPTLFDGVTSRPLLDGIVDQAIWNVSSTTYYTGTYFDGWYYLHIGGSNGYALDLRNYPNVKVTKVSRNAGAFVIVPYDTNGPTPGLYVVDNTSGAVSPWRPMEGSNVTGATQSVWLAYTGYTDLGMPGKVKRVSKVRATVTGSITLTLNALFPQTSALSTTLTLTASNRVYSLPGGFDGANIQAQLVASSGTDKVLALSLIGEVFDDA